MNTIQYYILNDKKTIQTTKEEYGKWLKLNSTNILKDELFEIIISTDFLGYKYKGILHLFSTTIKAPVKTEFGGGAYTMECYRKLSQTYEESLIAHKTAISWLKTSGWLDTP